MARGLFCGLKLLNYRKKTKKKNTSRFIKAAEKSPLLRGLVLSKISVEAKQPNSAIRKCLKIRLFKNGKTVKAFVPNDGGIKFISEHDTVLVQGNSGKLGRSPGDLGGVSLKVIKVNGNTLRSLTLEKTSRY